MAENSGIEIFESESAFNEAYSRLHTEGDTVSSDRIFTSYVELTIKAISSVGAGTVSLPLVERIVLDTITISAQRNDVGSMRLILARLNTVEGFDTQKVIRAFNGSRKEP